MTTPVIPPVSDHDARPETAALLSEIGRKTPRIPNLLRTAAHSPIALEVLWRDGEAICRMPFSERQRTAVALRLAELNQCAYSLAEHGARGRDLGITEDEICKFRNGLSADLREQALLALTTKIYKDRGHNAGFAVALARQVGLTDAEIIEVVTMVAHYALTHYISSVAQTEVDEYVPCGEVESEPSMAE